MRGEAIAPRGDRDVLVQVQRLSQDLRDHVLGIRINFRAVVENHSNGGAYFLKFQ
jgi:hypothetical protein